MEGGAGRDESGQPGERRSLAGRLGIGAPEERDDRLAWRLVFALLLVYAVSFFAFYPNAITNDDESQYLRQAAMILEGRSTIVQIDPFTGDEYEKHPSTYPPGLAAMMAPLVWAFDWKAAYVVPLLGLLAAVLLTGLCLKGEGRSPIFALIVLGYLPTLVMGRVAMSDVPSAAVVALGLLCFFRGIDGDIRWWLASGFVAGASLTLRISNPLLFAPLFAGTVLRRETRCWALVVGGVLGLCFRMAAMYWYFGDPFFERGYYPFAPETILDRLEYYLFGLLVLVPGGLLFALLYKGQRRPEILLTILAFISFYLLQRFSTDTTGVAKRIVLALRYFIPLLPLLAIACAESLPRLWQQLRAASPPGLRQWSTRLTSVALASGILGLAVAAAAVHPFFASWSATQAVLADEIRRQVPLDAVLVTNHRATRKFVRELERKYKLVRRDKTEPEDVTRLARTHPELYLVLLDRTESRHWKRNAAANADLLTHLEVKPRLVSEVRISNYETLRIWRIAGS